MWAKFFQRKKWRGCRSVHTSPYFSTSYVFECEGRRWHRGLHRQMKAATLVQWDGNFRVS